MLLVLAWCLMNNVQFHRVQLFLKIKCFRVEVPQNWNLYSSEFTRLSITHTTCFPTGHEEKKRRIQCVTGDQRIFILIILLWLFLWCAVKMNNINALWRRTDQRCNHLSNTPVFFPLSESKCSALFINGQNTLFFLNLKSRTSCSVVMLNPSADRQGKTPR